MKTSLFIALVASMTLAAAQNPEIADFPKSKIPGTWLLNGAQKAPRFVLKKNGSFAYSGVGATSKGTWSYDGKMLKLVWSAIDGSKLIPGAVKGKFAISPQGILMVNTFSTDPPKA